MRDVHDLVGLQAFSATAPPANRFDPLTHGYPTESGAFEDEQNCDDEEDLTNGKEGLSTDNEDDSPFVIEDDPPSVGEEDGSSSNKQGISSDTSNNMSCEVGHLSPNWPVQDNQQLFACEFCPEVFLSVETLVMVILASTTEIDRFTHLLTLKLAYEIYP